MNSKHPETLALHAGWRRDSATNSVAVPIYQTTSYQFDSSEHARQPVRPQGTGQYLHPHHEPDQRRAGAAARGDGGRGRGADARVGTGGIGVLGAEFGRQTGDNIVTSTDLYGGTWNLFANTLKEPGDRGPLRRSHRPRGVSPRATDDRTRAYYAETLPNPKLIPFPIAEVAAIGRRFGVPLIMDNTAAPLLVRPFDHGAAVVMYSTTKYIGGHGTSIGGVVIDGGNFDWEANPARQPLLNEPDPSYHGAVWTQAVKPLGPIAYILKMRVTLLRDLGAAMAPFNAFLFLQGVETLALRMRAHSENALAVANYLAERRGVSRVIHPARHTGVGAQRTAKYLTKGMGGLMGFELAGGVEAGRKFIDSLKMIYHVANIGDVRTLAIHPASTTHSQLSEEEQFSTGVTPGYVRLSVGIEHIDDILADLGQALDAVGA